MPAAPEAELTSAGKVRDLYRVDDERILIVATDRISAFDVVLDRPVPDKGRVLTALTLFWLARTAEVVANHLLGARPDELPSWARTPELAGRSMLCRRLDMLPIECVVRGYLIGSGLRDYQRDGAVSGHRLPAGLVAADRLPEPIFTPASKAQTGHDENITRAAAADLIGAERLAEVERVSLELYRAAADYAAARGITIADTKFEFGTTPDGTLVLADEVLTPDSSRFWPADRHLRGESPPSFDKQYVRDYLDGLDWDKTPPAPPLPASVLEGTASRYREAYERLSGRSFSTYLTEMAVHG